VIGIKQEHGFAFTFHSKAISQLPKEQIPVNPFVLRFQNLMMHHPSDQ